MNFDFVKKIHRLIEKLPEKEKEYKILYPEAFKLVEITPDVKFEYYGSSWPYFRLSYKGIYFGELKPYAKKGFFFQSLENAFNYLKSQGDDEVVKKQWSKQEALYTFIDVQLDNGFKVEFNALNYFGFRFFCYGGQEIVDLEFNSKAEKNRIKEKD